MKQSYLTAEEDRGHHPNRESFVIFNSRLIAVQTQLRGVNFFACSYHGGALDSGSSSSSRMRVINHNWSATKQRPHPQSVAEISRHSVLSGDRIRQCETSSGSRHKDTDQCL